MRPRNPNRRRSLSEAPPPDAAAEEEDRVAEAEPPASKPKTAKPTPAAKPALPPSDDEALPPSDDEALAPPASEPTPTDATPTDDSAGASRGLGSPAPEAPPVGGLTGTPPPPPPPPPATPPPGGTAAEEQKDGYDIVPVYYGTDRELTEAPKRIDYGANRGRKLALGRALVTIPKSHVQPTIERPWAIRIPYTSITLYEEAEDPEKHFTLQELKALSRADFLKLVRERLAKSQRFKDHALVFVHGYNTTFDNGVYRTAQIAYDLKFDGAPFLYSWPSGGGVASYTYDRESAGQAVPFMRDFLDMVIKETGAKSVSVVAHSMGNQPTLQVLKDIKASSPPGIVISQIILAAPDVDRDNFENIARDIQGLASGITLYAAANDRALGVSRRFHGGVPRAGDVPDGGPLVLPGVDTIDVTAVSTDSFGLNHSGYAENNALLNDLQLLIQTGERPPEKRVPILEKVGTALGAYWRYPLSP